MRRFISTIRLPPQLSKGKQTSRWAIHSEQLQVFLPWLCNEMQVHEIASNLMFRCLEAIRQNGKQIEAEEYDSLSYFEMELNEALKTIFKTSPNDEANINNKELIFAVLNPEVLQMVSPKLRRQERAKVIKTFQDCFKRYAYLNPSTTLLINMNDLFDCVGPANFLDVAMLLGIPGERVMGEVSVTTLEKWVHHSTTEENKSGNAAIQLACYYAKDEKVTLETPLLGGRVTLKGLLQFISRKQSPSLMDYFIRCLPRKEIKMEALHYFEKRNYHTGLLSDPWGYAITRKYIPLLLDPETPISLLYTTHMHPILVDISMPQNDSTTPQESSHNTLTAAHESNCYEVPLPLGKIHFIHTTEQLRDSFHALQQQYTSLHPMPLSDATKNWTSNDEFSDVTPHPISINLQDTAVDSSTQYACMALDLEWTAPHSLSLVTIATPSYVLLIDTLTHDTLYLGLLLHILKWILRNPYIIKLFYNHDMDIHQLGCFYHTADFIGKSVNCIDLSHNRLLRKLRSSKTEYVDELMNTRDTDVPHAASEQTGLPVMQLEDEIKMQEVVMLRNSAETNTDDTLQSKLFQGNTMLKSRSLSHLCSMVLDIPLDKTLRNSNWNRRPLSVQQTLYAARDAYVLLELESRLQKVGIFPTTVIGRELPSKGVNEDAQ